MEARSAREAEEIMNAELRISPETGRHHTPDVVVFQTADEVRADLNQYAASWRLDDIATLQSKYSQYLARGVQPPDPDSLNGARRLRVTAGVVEELYYLRGRELLDAIGDNLAGGFVTFPDFDHWIVAYHRDGRFLITGSETTPPFSSEGLLYHPVVDRFAMDAIEKSYSVLARTELGIALDAPVDHKDYRAALMVARSSVVPMNTHPLRDHKVRFFLAEYEWEAVDVVIERWAAKGETADV